MYSFPWPLLSLTVSSFLSPCIQASARIQEFPAYLLMLNVHVRLIFDEGLKSYTHCYGKRKELKLCSPCFNNNNNNIFYIINKKFTYI